MRSSKASAENMVLKIVANLDFEPSESAIDRAISYVEGLLNKSGDLFKIVSDPSRMDKVRAKVIEILVVGSVAKRNPRDARASSRKEEYSDYDEWERDAFAAGATQIVKVGDGLSAIRTKDGSMLKVDAEGYFDPRSRYGVKMRKNFINIGAWYMDSGTIYRHIIKNHPEFFAYENPLRPRKGESARAFVSRCMSEEKMSFPEPKQRIAVCLSKSRKRNPVYDTGSDE